jgi:hypothetical protein
LVGHPTLSDGIYEVKMELFKYVGGVSQRVNWTAEGINLFIPTNNIVTFQNNLITTQPAPAAYQYRLAGGLENPAGDLFGFKMKIFVDNNPPVISIDDFYVDAPGNSPDCCGFVKYADINNSNIHLEFTAKQKNNFADFQVGIAGYQGIDTVDADTFIPSGAGTFLMTKGGVPTSETFVGNVNGEYSGEIPVSGALAGCVPACTKKVLGIGLNIAWYAQNGTNHIWGGRDTRSASFAIES